MLPRAPVLILGGQGSQDLSCVRLKTLLRELAVVLKGKETFLSLECFFKKTCNDKSVL